MITAHLYLDLNLRLDKPLRILSAREYIRIMLEHPLQEETVPEVKPKPDTSTSTALLETDNNGIAFTSLNSFVYTINRNRNPHAVFRRWRQLGTRTYAYLLEGLSDFPLRRYAASMPNIEEVGFREPDKNVNLHKLRRKLRSKKKMKELLLRYFRS